MALAKNSIVVPRVTLFGGGAGQQPFGFGGGGIPIIGTVESVGPAVVCWLNGTRVTYQTEAELEELDVASPAALALYHHRVRVAAFADEPGDPAGQGASEGLVIGVFTTKSGQDICIVQFSANDIAVFSAAFCFPID
jgi:hypothetical protein